MTREQFVLLCRAQALVNEAIDLSKCGSENKLNNSIEYASDLIEESIRDYAITSKELSRFA